MPAHPPERPYPLWVFAGTALIGVLLYAVDALARWLGWW